MSAPPTARSPFACCLALALGLSLGTACATEGHATAAPHAAAPTPSATVRSTVTTATADPQAVVERIRAALAQQAERSRPHVLVGDDPALPPGHKSAATESRKATARSRPRTAPPPHPPAGAAHSEGAHWGYNGAHGPEHWAAMKPAYQTCATGQRQSPIHIQTTDTAPGPAEPIAFHYRASGGSVVHNGHTIQVNLDSDQSIRVRGSTYQLVQFHFHHPAEERIDGKRFAMVAHLVHRNETGQLAIVAVLMDPGASSPFLDQLWTHMPLEAQDRVPLPEGSIDLGALLPSDQRYYQFMGSLTTPPCTEGVLWLVLKQPVTLSDRQRQLFARLFPMNARPVQALNGRLVREAQ